MKKAAAIMIMLSLLASLYLAYRRVVAERDYRTVEIMIDYDELKALAAGNNISLEEAAAAFAQKGATAVLARERSLEELEKSGDVLLMTGGEARIKRSIDKNWLPGLILRDDYTLLLFHDRDVFAAVYEQLKLKKKDVIAGDGDGFYYLSTFLTEKEIEKMGVGFLKKDAAAVAKGGLAFVPRIREWAGASRAYFAALLKTLQDLPGVAMIAFNDPSIPASDALPFLADGLQEMGISVGMFEFFPQSGLPALAWLVDKNVVRIHSIGEDEMPKYNENKAAERFRLAVAERNVRAVYLRFFGINNPGVVWDRSLNYVSKVMERLADEGFSTGTPSGPAGLPYSAALMFVIGLGVIGGALLLTEHFPIPVRWSVILGIIAVFGWGGLLVLSPLLARKAMALSSVLIFPVLALLSYISERRKTLAQAVFTLLKIAAVSFAGALIMTGLLADKSFMLKLNSFSGVKLAHILPLLIIPAYYLLADERPLDCLKGLLAKPVTYLYLGAGAVFLAGAAVYLLRTGNDAPLLVSSWEVKFREALDYFLGVRPRTKEFMFGHPALLALLYFGYDKKRIIKTGLLLLAVIGQVSLVNTYAHLHTPLLVSFIRSAHGLWIGIILGVCLVYAAGCCFKLLFREGSR